MVDIGKPGGYDAGIIGRREEVVGIQGLRAVIIRARRAIAIICGGGPVVIEGVVYELLVVIICLI